MTRDNIKQAIKLGLVAVPSVVLTACGGSAEMSGQAGNGIKTWTPQDMVGGNGTAMGGTTITNETISTAVRNVATWILGIAIILFVLRMVLTAVDRMVFANLGLNARVPFSYPNPGDERWDDDERKAGAGEGWSWKKIFLNFAKNVAIAAGAWLIVNIIVSVVSYFLNAGLSGGTQ